MGQLTASEARANIYRLMDEAATSHEPILITGKRHNAVLISQEDWEAIQETLYLLSIPGINYPPLSFCCSGGLQFKHSIQTAIGGLIFAF